MTTTISTRKRWVGGGTLSSLVVAGALLLGPHHVGAQDATPTPTVETTPAAETAPESTVTQAEESSGFAADDMVVVSDGPLNLRAEAGTSAEVVTTLAEGAELEILSGPESADDFDWYEVQTADGDSGWVAADFISTESSSADFAAGDTIEVVDGPLNLRTDSSIDADVVTKLDAGTTAKILDGPVDSGVYDWYEIEVDGETTGWVAADFIGLAGSQGEFSVDDVLVVTDGPLNLRDEAGTDADVVTQLETGAQVTVTDGPEEVDGYTWYSVETSDGDTGWVAADFVALDGGGASQQDIAIGDGVRVQVDGANFRADAGLDGEVIDQLDLDALLLVQDGPVVADGYTWYQVFNYYYGEGWVAGELVSVDPDGFPGEGGS